MKEFYKMLNDEQASAAVGGNANNETIITHILSTHFGISADDISPSTSIAADLGADSLDIVDVVRSLEEQFCINVADDQIANLRTVGDIVQYINSVCP